MNLWNYWTFLFLAIIFEVCGTFSMKVSNGFTKLIPSILIFICYGIAFTFLTFALKSISVGVAYAIWSGAGTFLVLVLGAIFFGEIITIAKIFFCLLIITGVVGLSLLE